LISIYLTLFIDARYHVSESVDLFVKAYLNLGSDRIMCRGIYDAWYTSERKRESG